MNKKGNGIIWAVAGAYLVYLGASLIKDVLGERPDNYILFMIAGAAFALIGAAVAVLGLKRIAAMAKAEQEDAEEAEQIDEAEEIEQTEE